MQNKNCLLCGVGGQGTILASKLIAEAAMEKGLFCRTSETIGMAQRGGSVVSHVRIGKDIASSTIPFHTVDVLIGFEPGEAVRALPYLKKDGILVVADRAVKPVTASLGGTNYNGEVMLGYLKENVSNLIIVSVNQVAHTCGTTKVVNVALLGAAVRSGGLGLSIEEVEQAVYRRVPEKFHSMNRKALYLS